MRRRWNLLAVVGLAAMATLARGDEGGQAVPAPAYASGVTVTRVLENDKVAVLRVDIGPGGREAPHSHDFDLVTVALTPATMEIVRGGETTRVERAAGEVAFVPKGAVHGSRNLGKASVEVIAIALKDGGHH
jgi:quercetin dioxygenase-like cupin family protein